MRKQAIGYTRVSTEKQAKEGISLSAQRSKIMAWCEYHEYDLMGVFTDEGVSGSSMKKRPELEHALKVVKKDMAFVTYSLSRLTRSTKDLLHIADLLHQKGADLVSLSENIDTTSAAGKMMFRMLGVIGEFEKDVIAERTRLAMQAKKVRGEYWGGQVPYGFTLNDEKKKLVPIEEEQAVIKLAKELREGQLPLLQISENLHKSGYLNRRGVPFHAMQVKRLVER